MKKLLTLTTALVAATTANAFDVEMYGSVNKAIMMTDDGNSTDFSIVDNNLATTYIGFAGEQALDNGLTASVLLDATLSGNNSASITQNTTGTTASTPDSIAASFNQQFARVGLSGNWGALFVGYQDTAVDDAFYSDLGAATDVMGAGVTAFGGGFVFKDSAGTNINVGGTAAQVSDLAFGHNGDLELENSIRYNSPEVNGFNGSLSVSQGGNLDAAIRYAADYGDFEVASVLGHSWENAGATGSTLESTTQASVAVKHVSGLAGSLAYTQSSLEGAAAGVDEGEGLYAKISYAWDNYGIGLDYAKMENALGEATDHEMTSVGLAGQVDLGAGVSAGALYRNYSLDATGISAEDIDVFALNMRVQF